MVLSAYTMRNLVVSIVLFNEARAQQSQPYRWSNVRIDGGGFVAGTVFNPGEQGLLYARTDMGGAYRLNKSNNIWIPLQDQLSLANQTGWGTLSLAVDPITTSKVYLATGLYTNGGAALASIYRSSDYGASWLPSPLNFRLGGNEDGRNAGERLNVDPNAPTNLLLGTNQNGLWASSDSAVTWAAVPGWNGPNSITFTLYDKASGTRGTKTPHIYVGCNNAGGASLYETKNGGSSWSVVAGAPQGQIPIRAAIDTAGTMFVTYGNHLGPNGMTAGSVHRLVISSGTWTDVTPPGHGGGFSGVDIDLQRPGVVIVTTLDWWAPDEIYYSTNNGNTWSGIGRSSVLGSPVPWIYWHNAQPSWAGWMGCISIDPFNSNRALHNTGQGLWTTWDLTSADSGQKTHWNFTNTGLEETVPLELVSPPTGAEIVSALGDIDGFAHMNVTISPQMFNPSEGTNIGLDVAWLKPNTFVRTHANGNTHGSYSTDGGNNWTLFPTQPGGGNPSAIAIAADASTIVWNGEYSANMGSSWTTCAGLRGGGTPVADRVNPLKFYVMEGNTLYVSTNGARQFTAGGNVQNPSGIMRAVFGLEGNLWVPSWNGLFRSTDSGATFQQVGAGTISQANGVGFGKAAPGQSHPAVFIFGTISGTYGIFRSDNAGQTWIRINDWAHQYGFLQFLIGDPKVYGRVYLSTNGRGIPYGDIAQ